MSTVSVIHLLGNCQLEPLYHYLQKQYPNITVRYYANYQFIGRKEPLPEQFYQCDVAIAQLVSEQHREYDPSTLKEKIPKVVGYPFIAFTGLFSGQRVIELLDPEIDSRYRNCSKHQYGIWEEHLRIPDLDQVEHEVQQSLQKLRDNELRSHPDVRGFADYIEQHFRARRLFYTSQHPTGELLSILYSKLCSAVGLSYCEAVVKVDNYFKRYSLPIHPELAESLKLKFTNLGGVNYHLPQLEPDYESWFSAVEQTVSEPTCRCYTKQLKFSHLAKNGGSSIENAALKSGVLWGKHDPEWRRAFTPEPHPFHFPVWMVTSSYRKNDPGYLNRYRFLAVVRHPLNRIISAINYHSNQADILDPDSAELCSLTTEQVKVKIVESFFDKFFDAPPYWPQKRFIYDPSGRKVIDHVIKFENLSTELPAVLKQYELEIELRHDNRSTKIVTAGDLTEQHRQKIVDYFAEDYLEFGYS